MFGNNCMHLWLLIRPYIQMQQKVLALSGFLHKPMMKCELTFTKVTNINRHNIFRISVVNDYFESLHNISIDVWACWLLLLTLQSCSLCPIEHVGLFFFFILSCRMMWVDSLPTAWKSACHWCRTRNSVMRCCGCWLSSTWTWKSLILSMSVR